MGTKLYLTYVDDDGNTREIAAVALVDANGDPATISLDTSDLATEATQALILAEAQEAVLALPPRMEGGQNGEVYTELVSITGAGDDTISAPVLGQALQMASCVLSATAATTLTFDSGGVDLILELPAAGVLDLAHKESGHNTGADNTVFKLTSTAGNIKGVIQYQQKAV